MKDRQFMMVLALVVAAGLVMGLIAFRMTSAGGAAGAKGTATTVGAHPSPADQVADQPADGGSSPTEPVDLQNGEPTPPAAEPPEMQGPGSGDPPGTAATEPSQPAASAEAPADTIQ